tara:strand:- start:755 stop:1126 length:372 start_codon:yes stop_codon:yes gene_type:complete
MPKISPAVAIFTDKRGTNARVRGNKRYGDYWAPKESFKYYKIRTLEEMKKISVNSELPIGIEKTAIAIGWDLPIDGLGNWKKNPIDISSASPSDYVVLCDKSEKTEKVIVAEEDHISSWLSDE